MITEEIRRWLEKPPIVRGIRSIEDMFVIGTDIGKSREENQDRVAVLKVGSPQRNRTSWCACVCDGMGGMKNGSQAASLSIAAFFSSLIANRRMEPKARLETAARAASEQVARDIPGGGATLSALLLEEGAAFTVNVGDSRIYQLIDGEDIHRLTVDDTLAEAFGAQDRGLLQYIGSKSRISPHVAQLDRLSGSVLITSDGAHLVGENLLNDMSRHAVDKSEYCGRVLDLANWIGGRDNATIIATTTLLPSSSANIEASSDVSVWGPDGRLKIMWTAGRTDSPVPGVAEEKPSKPHQNIPGSEPGREPLRVEPDKKPRKRKSSKPKREQIEIGFSDEGAGIKNGDS